MRVHAFVVVTVGISSLLMACTSDGEPESVVETNVTTSEGPSSATMGPPEPTESARATPSDLTKPPAALRDFAQDVQAALLRGRVEFFSDRFLEVRGTCSASYHALGGCPALDQSITGVAFAKWRTDEAGVVTQEYASDRISALWRESTPGATDAFGPGLPVVYAMGATNLPGPAYALVLTAIVQSDEGSERLTLVSHWIQSGSIWELYSVLEVPVMDEDFLEPTEAGRGWMRTWERF